MAKQCNSGTMERMEIVTDFIFLGSRITADGDCSHEIKRCSWEDDLPPEKSECRSRNNRTEHGTTDSFQTGKGVCQGCILSPCVFSFYAEYIMRNAGLEEAQAGIKIVGNPWDFPGNSTGVGCRFLLQGNFLTW